MVLAGTKTSSILKTLIALSLSSPLMFPSDSLTVCFVISVWTWQDDDIGLDGDSFILSSRMLTSSSLKVHLQFSWVSGLFPRLMSLTKLSTT